LTPVESFGLIFIFLTMVFALSDEIVFPDPSLADEDGLLAMGGDLSRERLLKGYQRGIFPWFSEGDPICWFAPHERCVIFPERIKLSKSMRKVMKDGIFKVTMNRAYEQVIRNCAEIVREGQDGTWITDDMQKAYIDLHKGGWAHSVEVWYGAELAGGLYGVVVNGVFCGESMFSLMSNASKTALIWLCQCGDFRLIDCQMPNDHLMSLGAEMIPREEYLMLLQLKR
jgi:leucyl/phenylalanyl-tRNA--protein transferase